MAYLNEIQHKGKPFKFPAFFPDATRGVIRSVDSNELKQTDVEGLIVNTYHLMTQPGIGVLKDIGGIHKLMSWDGWTISDSGGFQVFSLILRNKKLGKITPNGVQFHLESTGQRTKIDFTPEMCIQTQFDIGADIFIVLDDFTPFNATKEQAERSVKHTIAWAKRCKIEFEKQLEKRGLTEENRPLLFGVVQGAQFRDLREYCAIELEKIGFDGYGLGGWVMEEDGKNVDIDLIKFISSVMPDNKPKYALGIGDPKSVIETVRAGYHIFDCVLPTRDARHHRLYNFTTAPDQVNLFDRPDTFEYLYLSRGGLRNDSKPISEYCDCLACKNYSRAYIHHLFKINDALAWRLATLHNLRTYSLLIENLRNNIGSIEQAASD